MRPCQGRERSSILRTRTIQKNPSEGFFVLCGYSKAPARLAWSLFANTWSNQEPEVAQATEVCRQGFSIEKNLWVEWRNMFCLAKQNSERPEFLERLEPLSAAIRDGSAEPKRLEMEVPRGPCD